MDSETVDIIQKLTDIDPISRLGYRSIEALKQHPFFEGMDFNELNERTIVPPKDDVNDDCEIS